jgi:hypothetical protein
MGGVMMAEGSFKGELGREKLKIVIVSRWNDNEI